MKRERIVRLAASLVVAALAAGCASGAASTAAPASARTPVAAPELATGVETCAEDPAPPADADAEKNYIVCERTMSDPRLSGTRHSTYDVDTSNPKVGVIWSEGTLTNEGGEWSCKELILGSENGVGARDEVCVGLGDYLGLTAYTHGTTPNTAADFGLIAWIEGTAATR